MTFAEWVPRRDAVAADTVIIEFAKRMARSLPPGSDLPHGVWQGMISAPSRTDLPA
jgi:hypothetical protein